MSSHLETPVEINPIPLEEKLPSEENSSFIIPNPSFEETIPQANIPTQSQYSPTKRPKPDVVFNVSGTKYRVVREIVNEQFDWILSETPETEWDVAWIDTSLDNTGFSRLKPFQKINFFPGVYCIARKDRLGNSLTKLKKKFPEEYDFFPETFVLPSDYKDFKAQFSKSSKPKVFIVKPQASSQGKGIFLTETWKNVPHTEKFVAQRYISRPYLLDGLKFDLRIYVLLASCNPLQIYLFEDGLVRFATEPYQVPGRSNIDDMCMHLTNYAINKESPNFIFNSSANDYNKGHKRTIKALFKTLEKKGHDTKALWEKIKQIVIKTFCCVQPTLTQNYKSHLFTKLRTDACFQVFGFDIIIDEDFKPWLLEVNASPSFSTDTPLDKSIKERVIGDTLKIMNISGEERINYKKRLKAYIEMKSITGKINQNSDLTKYISNKPNNDKEVEESGFEKIYPPERSSHGEEDYEAYLDEAYNIWSASIGVYTEKRDYKRKKSSQKPLERSLSKNAGESNQEEKLLLKAYQTQSTFLSKNISLANSPRKSHVTYKENKRTPSKEFTKPFDKTVSPHSYESASASLRSNKTRTITLETLNNNHSYSLIDHRIKGPQTELSTFDKESNKSIDNQVLEEHEISRHSSFFYKTSRGRKPNETPTQVETPHSSNLLRKANNRPFSATVGNFKKVISIPKAVEKEERPVSSSKSATRNEKQTWERLNDRVGRPIQVALQIPSTPVNAIHLEAFTLQKICLDRVTGKDKEKEKEKEINILPKRFVQQLSKTNIESYVNNMRNLGLGNGTISLKTLEHTFKRAAKRVPEKEKQGKNVQSYGALMTGKGVKYQQAVPKLGNFIIPKIFGQLNSEISKNDKLKFK